MKIYGWSGHNNLGDDAMAEVIKKEFAGSKFDFMGGGTLLTPGGMDEFVAKVEDPENTIAISIGVSDTWNKNIDPEVQHKHQALVDKLRRFKKIYTRDYYSHLRLKELSIDNTLSVDLLCYYLPKTTKHYLPRPKKYANLIVTETTYSPYHTQALELMNHDGYELFALSNFHDLGEVHKDAQVLVDKLYETTVVATRLHANVLAWMAGAKVTPIAYDRKVSNFYERVAFLTPEKANKIIMDHIKEIKSLKGYA